ncbi:carbohydrate kinase family protein [Ureaplasma sp. ES3154-GEN]|uniref:carbohydrate kinase family protein n=1 Tax=Ureaplasma sp. ES3154-GEN TaxID=2984844 RepID=UPI0021E722CC|nr:carbohydrate kinase family protein [Ureaplasma sp. ES3154-GEN]MCV3743397.1 carbohydrate kinase family protein [Ureaplasma sp. ES3154-GEN]
MKILVIGAVTVDLLATVQEPLIYNDSNPGNIYQTYGGVAKNIAENLVRLGFDVDFVFNVGNDKYGENAIDYLRSININTLATIYPHSTDVYLSVFDDQNELVVAINDMPCVNHIDINYLVNKRLNPDDYAFVICDANMQTATIKYVLNQFKNVYIEGVSAKKIVRLRSVLNEIQTLKANFLEICTLLEVDNLDELIQKLQDLKIPEVLITMGSKGSLLFKNQEVFQIPAQLATVTNVSGAGDAFLAGFLYTYYLAQKSDPYELLIGGSCASLITLRSPLTNSLELNPINLEKEIKLWKSKS